MTPAVTPNLMSPQEFAGRVRAKYPGAYDTLSDQELTNRIVTKYPEYGGKVQLASQPQRPTDPVLQDPSATVDARADKISNNEARAFPFMAGGGIKDLSQAATPSLLSMIRSQPAKRLASAGWAATKAAAGETPIVGKPIREGLKAAVENWKSTTPMLESGDAITPWRDATRMNVPYAGEEIEEAPQTGLQPWRDATRMNVPYAGEEIEEAPQTGLQPWRDATRMNVPYAGEEIEVSKPRLIEQMGGQPAENIGTPSSKTVLSPEEFQSRDQQMSLAKKMASQRGMQYAAGMKPGPTQ
jgi:hypothetical protein